MKLYLAGPMTGVPYFNFPAFRLAAELLRRQGHTVFNPADNGADVSVHNPEGSVALAIREHGFDPRDALATGLSYICRHADGIAMLPGWENSKGARAEHATAVALGLIIMYLP